MIPVMAGGSFCMTNIPWQDRSNAEEDDGDGQSADSSRCPSRGGTPEEGGPDESDKGATRTGGRFPRSSTMVGGDAKKGSAVEVVELKCEHDAEAALQDLLGLRVSGSRSAGVFVQNVHIGSVADVDGRIEVGDQLLSVESISLIGMTPDQVVRVLRAAYSYTTLSVRVTVAHQWAEKAERAVRLPSSLSVSHGLMSSSRSEGALSARSNNEEASESTSANAAPSLLRAPRLGAGKSGMVSRRPSPPARTPAPLAPLPGVLSSIAPVEVHRTDKVFVTGPVDAPPARPHAQGATKLRRDRPSQSVDQTTTANCDLEEESSLATTATNVTPSSISPAGSTSRFDSILDMYDSRSSEKFDTVSTLPPGPATSRRRTVADHVKRKSSLPFPVLANSDQSNLEIMRAKSIDRDTPPILPCSMTRAMTLRHRRVCHQSETGSAGSGNKTDSNSSTTMAVTGLSRRFSPKLSGSQLRAWGSDESLQLPILEEEDRFNVGKPVRSLHADDIKNFISSAQRKSLRSMKEKATNEELPLVSFDLLNQTPPSPTENSRRATESGSSGQSKSSKGSISSQGSQKLSWQCPVCLDGASRIRRTKRRMMSTACGHVFCSSCVEDVVGKYHMCPTCRMTIRSMKDVHPIFM